MSIRLFLVPFAGGSSYSYRGWQNHVGPEIDVLPVEFPGRGRRPGEPLLTTMDALVADVLEQIQPDGEPYAIFGHSMGACVAYLVARRICDEGYPPPLHLFLSGRNGVSTPSDDRRRHLLPTQDFIEVLRQMGGCPEEILADDDMTSYFVPILRADFQAHASYLHEPAASLGLPFTALLGEADCETSRAEVGRWQEETGQPLEVLKFGGGHFFIFDHINDIGKYISRRLLAPQFGVRTVASDRC
jgi:surfactin synthase thioesterase subunit